MSKNANDAKNEATYINELLEIMGTYASIDEIEINHVEDIDAYFLTMTFKESYYGPLTVIIHEKYDEELMKMITDNYKSLLRQSKNYYINNKLNSQLNLESSESVKDFNFTKN